MTPPTFDELTLLHSHVCQALSDPKRIMILYALYNQPCHVNGLAAILGAPQPTVSRHLRVLRQQNLVTTERQGTTIVYTLADERIITVLDGMRQILRDMLARQSDMLQVS